MDSLPNWQIYGVPVAYVLVCIVNWLKTAFGMDVKWAFPVATGLAAVFGVLLVLSERYEIALVIFQVFMGAILLGLTASGLYSNTKYYVNDRLGYEEPEKMES